MQPDKSTKSETKMDNNANTIIISRVIMLCVILILVSLLLWFYFWTTLTWICLIIFIWLIYIGIDAWAPPI